MLLTSAFEFLKQNIYMMQYNTRSFSKNDGVQEVYFVSNEFWLASR